MMLQGDRGFSPSHTSFSSHVTCGNEGTVEAESVVAGSEDGYIRLWRAHQKNRYCEFP